MGDVIRQAWELLTVGSAPAAAVAPIAIADLIAGGETRAVEFKSTLRMNLHTGQVDDKIQVSALKTIAGFLNAKGGTLLIGVADNGEVLGLDADGFQRRPSRDHSTPREVRGARGSRTARNRQDAHDRWTVPWKIPKIVVG
jgi:hypothetical protein